MPFLAGAAAVSASAVLGLSTARAQGDVWREHRRDDLGFRVEMPGAPKIEAKEEDVGDVRTRSIVAEVEHEQMTLGVQHQEWKELMPADDQFRLFREGMRLGGMPVTREIPLTMNGFPAREFIREADDINFIRREVVVDKLTIAATVMGERSIHGSPTVRRFMASFMLLRGAR